jgi:tetratricopeptide (TPR) repeat protein
VQEVLAAAIEMHRIGQFEPAGKLYESILAREPENADALHLFGALHHQQGDHAGAVQMIRRAIALQPSVPAYHANLAEAHRSLGQLDRAVGCCRIALQLWPDYPEAHGNLGVALQNLNRHAEAIEHFQRALQLSPELASVHSNLAISLRQLKRRDEALVHFRKAVELDPKSASARTNLGLLLLDCGKADEALAHGLEAVALDPEKAALHLNLGNMYRELGRPLDAKAAYTEAITLDSELAVAHANLASVLQSEAKFGQALPWLRRAVELRPDDASSWEQLGDLHMELESPAEAIPCYERALILRPARPLTLNALGWALQDENRFAEAEEQYRASERLKPDMPATQLNLGGMHEERGDLAEAEYCFRKALALNPQYAMPHARLATLLGGKLGDGDLSALEARLATLRTDDDARPALLFGLARVLDARREFKRAADVLIEANSLSLEQARKRRRAYDADQHDEFVGNLIRSFDSAFFARTSEAGSSARRPVFIFGLPRSGTTLIEQILASHSRIHGAGELVLVRQSFEAIPSITERAEPPLHCVPALTASRIGQLAARHLQWLHRYDEGKAERIVDKMPENYLYLGLVAAMFPKATFIHCRRDLRDVAVSCWMTHFRSIRWANDPKHIGERFAQYRRIMDHWRNVLPISVHEVDYEETVDDLEGVARRLVSACGLEWEPACLQYHRTRRVVRTASVTQIRQPIYKRSVARWKNYETALAELFAALPKAHDPGVHDESEISGLLSSIPPNPVQEFV